GINVLPSRIYDETTLLLTPDQLGVLQSKASYLIAMATTDISKLSKAELFGSTTASVTIHSPSNEPTIGVIDTMFREDVYFKDWVEFEKNP
ncbi:MAG: serine protease, partial [Eubacteriales bacterium]|nr:serine protease [Eubacteriales bacterium]